MESKKEGESNFNISQLLSGMNPNIQCSLDISQLLSSVNPNIQSSLNISQLLSSMNPNIQFPTDAFYGNQV